MSLYRGGAYALLAFVILVIYGQFLWNPIVFDDLPFFMAGSDRLDGYSRSFAPFEPRWLPYATIAWTKRLLGLDLIWFRLAGMALHTLTGMAFLLFLRQLYQQIYAGSIAELDQRPWLVGTLISALLFVVHPVAVYGAGYLVQRTIVMATLFSLLALISYMKCLEKGSRIWLWATAALYFMAVLSKEQAIMLPAVMLAITVLTGGNRKLLFQRLWPVYLAFLLIGLYVVSQKLWVIGRAYEIYAPEMLGNSVAESGGDGNNSHLLSILTQCALFFKYLGLWLLPNPAWMSVDMREPFAESVLSPYLAAAFGFLAYGAVAIRLLIKRGGAGLVGLAMLFPWILFFTEFSTIRIQEPFVLYRSYLWAPGIFIALPLLLMRASLRVAIITGVALVTLLSIAAADRLTTFSHPLLLWDDAEKLVHERHNLPGVDRIYGNRAKYFDDVKRYPDALADYQTALSLRPDFAHYHQGMGITYLNMGNHAAARDAFTRASELDPKSIKSHYGRGLANEGLGHRMEALEDFKKSCELGWNSGCNKAQEIGRGAQFPNALHTR